MAVIPISSERFDNALFWSYLWLGRIMRIKLIGSCDEERYLSRFYSCRRRWLQVELRVRWCMGVIGDGRLSFIGAGVTRR